MSSLQHKIDFAVILCVNNANPNGDPLNGNRPRTDYNGYGEISDVCIKRKIRDRLLDRYCQLGDERREGQAIFVQSDDRKIDDMKSLKERAESEQYGLGKDAWQFQKPKKGGRADGGVPEKTAAKKEDTAKAACAKWFDVRAFGQLFAFKKSSSKKNDAGEESDTEPTVGDGISIPIRGPVSIHAAFSVEPVSVASIQITKSVSGEGDGTKRGSDTMGMKHRVDKGIYVFYGSMNPQLAERTGFSDADSEIFKSILLKLLENDASSARPEGSMSVLHVFWWKHNCKTGQYSSAKVHKSLHVNADGTYSIDASATPGLQPGIFPGF
jgi:CRISPR-associated protein Csd2